MLLCKGACTVKVCVVRSGLKDLWSLCRLDNGTHAVDVLKISSTDKEADAFLVLEGKASTRGTTTCKQVGQGLGYPSDSS